MPSQNEIRDFPHRLIRAMFNPPEFLVPLLNRAHLLECLDAASARPVIVIQAPAGCGKSTLLAQWRKARELSGDHCIWLNVPRVGLDVADLTLSLAWALHLGGIELQDPHLLDEFGVDALPPRHAIAMVLASLSLQERATTLFIDDFEQLCDPAALELFENFAAGLPRNVRLVIASRDHLPSGLSRMLSHGLVEILHAENLIFSAHEALSLLCEDMSPEDAEILHRRTEGWPVAVQLAKIWMRQGYRGTVDLDDFTGETGAIAGYLLDQVLSALPDHMRLFLQNTSVLERITPGLAEAVHKESDARSLLRQLPSLQPLIVTLDRREQIYRLHPLLADCLQQQLRLHDRGRYERLQRSAALSFAQHGNLPEAVRHALAAKDHDLACRIMEESDLLGICTRIGTAEINNCLNQLAEEDWRRHRRIWLCRIFLLLRQGRWTAATSEYRELMSAMPNESETDVLDRITIEALIATNQPAESEALYERLVSECSELGLSGVRADRILLMLKVVGELQRGNLGSATDALQNLASTYPNPDLPGSATFLKLHAAHIKAVRGQIGEVRDDLRRLTRVSRRIWGPDRSVAAMARVIMLQMDYEQDRVEFSEKEVAGLAESLHGTDAWFDFHANLNGIGTELAYRDGGSQKALQFLSQARDRAARWLGDGSLERILVALEADIFARSGSTESAQSKLSLISEDWTTLATWQERTTLLAASVRLSLARADYGDAVRRATIMRSEAQQQGRGLSTCRASVALAAAYHRAGETQSALGAFQCAISLATRERSIAPFLEYRSEISELLGSGDALAVLSTRLNSEEFAFLRLLQSSLPETEVGKNALHRLSQRETEILLLLCQENSNKHIARAANIGEDAVKYHLKNIYRKLGISSRQDAIGIGSQYLK